MTFRSILYAGTGSDAPTGLNDAPEFFGDLNLDQIVASVTAGRAEYDLMPFFYRPLDDFDDIAYRQEVVRDLEDAALHERIAGFALEMREMRSHLRAAGERYYRLNKEGWFVDAVAIYCAAIERLAADLAATSPGSRGFRELREYLARYLGSQSFETLVADTGRVQAKLRSVRYCIRIHGLSVTVSNYGGEADYSAEIEQTFAKFRQGDVKDHSVNFPRVLRDESRRGTDCRMCRKAEPGDLRQF